jgi:hypothetical protein
MSISINYQGSSKVIKVQLFTLAGRLITSGTFRIQYPGSYHWQLSSSGQLSRGKEILRLSDGNQSKTSIVQIE